MNLPNKKFLMFGIPVLILAATMVWWLMPSKAKSAERYVTATLERGSLT